jgi:hypothetical protein
VTVVIDARTAPAPRSTVATEVLDGEAVLHDAATGQVHLLNAAASIVWQLLDGETTIEDIAAAIADATGEDFGQVSSDTIDLVRMLGGLGVIADIDPAAVEPPSP